MNLGFLATVILGGVAALDAMPFAQTMLSQPLVTATLLGLVWGDMGTALEVGVVLQILAATTLPVGSRTPEDYATGGVVGTGLALALARHEPFAMARESCMLAGVIAGLVTASAGVVLLKWQRRRNEALSHWCEAEIRSGAEGALASSHRAAAALSFAVGMVTVAAGLALGMWLMNDLVGRESLRLARAWSLARPLWIGLGLAHVLHAFVQRRLTRAAAFGGGLVATWLVLMVGSR